MAAGGIQSQVGYIFDSGHVFLWWRHYYQYEYTLFKSCWTFFFFFSNSEPFSHFFTNALILIYFAGLRLARMCGQPCVRRLLRYAWILEILATTLLVFCRTTFFLPFLKNSKHGTPYDVCITSLRANVCVIFLATRYNLITQVCQFRSSKSCFMTILAIALIVSFQFHTLYKVGQSFQFISRCSRVWMLCRYPALQWCCALQSSHLACHDCVCVMLYISTARITFCVQNPFPSCLMMTIAHRTWPSLAMSLVS